MFDIIRFFFDLFRLFFLACLTVVYWVVMLIVLIGKGVGNLLRNDDDTTPYFKS